MSAAPKPGAFASVTDAWFWTMRTLVARRHGMVVERRWNGSEEIEPGMVVKALDRLYRARRIDLQHARILRIWGEGGAVPPADDRDRRVWDEAMALLDWPLRVAGVVR